MYGKIINRQDHFYEHMQAQQHIDCLKAEKLKKLEDSEFRGMVETLKNQLSDPAHLIPELLQNAEDAGADHVRIQLDEDRLLFQHDGDRFEAEHVTAICGMCQSTKKSSLEYIGTFGVGFKSTFAVSKNPEIHSGAYSFQFDDETVIVPNWIEQADKYSNWNVTIVLPLNDRHSYESVSKQLEAFEVTSAKPMIFLRKLKEISIQRNGTEVSFEISGIEITGLNKLGENFEFVELRKNGTAGKRFCVYTLSKIIPSDLLEHVQKKRRLKLTEGYNYETNVKVAFEVESDGHIVASKDGHLNAFLPTRIRTFLTFDVNAGFLLSPERESLESVEDKYNCWLIECAIKALKDVIEAYKKTASSEFWPDIYQLFPLQEDTREDWIEKKLCIPIKDYFRLSTLFLVSEINNPWRQLLEVIEAPKEIRLLFPVFLEIDHKSGEFGHRAYLSDSIDVDLRQALVKEFELAKIDEDFLIDTLSKRDLLKDRDAAWLLSLFALLGKKYSTLYSWSGNWKQKEFLDKARQCYLIPCEDGSTVKLSEGAVVYRSTSGLPDFIYCKALELRQDLLKALNQDIKEEGPRERQQYAREFIWELTKEATPENLYNYTISQEFEKAGDGELDEQVCESLDNYALFLKDNDVTKSDIKLRIKGKREYRKAENLYLANSYIVDSSGLPLYDIERLLSGCDDVLFVSSHYLNLAIGSKGANSTTAWSEFLIKCGVKDLLGFKQRNVFDAKSKDEFAKKFLKVYHQQLPSQLDGSGMPYTGNDRDYRGKIGYKNAYKLLDWHFVDNFLRILDERLEAQDTDFFLEFLKMLDCKWEDFKNYLSLPYFYTYTDGGKKHVKESVLLVPSSLTKWLQEKKWLPARSLSDGKIRLKLPSEVYLFTAETSAGIKGGFYVEQDSVKSLELRRLLDLRTARPEQEPISSREEPIDVILEKYGKWVVDNPPLDKEMEKFIRKMYLRVNDIIKDDANVIRPKLETHMVRVYDASRNLNDLSKVHYYVSDISIINDLRDDVKREVLFLPGGLEPDSIKVLLTALNKYDLLAEISRVLPENVRSREEETSCFRDLANALWSFLKEEKDKDGEELKTCCQKIAEIKAHSAQNLRYQLHREAEPISSWIETDGILYKGVFWFSGDLRDLNVQVAKEICMEFGFEKPIKDFIKEVFSRSINSVTKSLKDRGKEYESIIMEKPKVPNARTISQRPETEPPLIDAVEKDIPIEEVKPIKVETGVHKVAVGSNIITHRTNSQGHSARDQHRHTREETGRRGEEIMEKKILPENFQGCKIRYVDESEYDFIVEALDGGIIYIEVKSSGSDEREFSFEMSEEQKLFAEQQGESYQLWFIMNVWDTKNPPYMGPCNYSELIEKGSLRMDPVHKTIYKCTVAVADISRFS